MKKSLLLVATLATVGAFCAPPPNHPGAPGGYAPGKTTSATPHKPGPKPGPAVHKPHHPAPPPPPKPLPPPPPPKHHHHHPAPPPPPKPLPPPPPPRPWWKLW